MTLNFTKQILQDLTKLKNKDFANWSKKLLNVKKKQVRPKRYFVGN